MSRPVGLKAITPGKGVTAPAAMGVALTGSEAEANVCTGGPGQSLQTRLRRQAEYGEVASVVQERTKCIQLNKVFHVKNSSSSLVSHNSTQSSLTNKVNSRVTPEMLLPCKQQVCNSSSTETIGVTRTLSITTKCPTSNSSSVNVSHASLVSPDHKHKRIKLIRSPLAVELTNPSNYKSEVKLDESAVKKNSGKFEKETLESECPTVKFSTKDSELVKSNLKTLGSPITKLKSDSNSPNKQVKKQKTFNVQLATSSPSGKLPVSTASNVTAQYNVSTGVTATISIPSDGFVTSDGTAVTNSINCMSGSPKNSISAGAVAVASLKKSELVDGRDSVRIAGTFSASNTQLDNSVKAHLLETCSNKIVKVRGNFKNNQPKTDRKTRQLHCYPNTSDELRTAVTNSLVLNTNGSSVSDFVCKVQFNKCIVDPSPIADQSLEVISKANCEPSLNDATSGISQPNSNSCKETNKLKTNTLMNSDFVKQGDALLMQRPSLEFKTNSSTLNHFSKTIPAATGTRRYKDDGQTSSASGCKIRTSHISVYNNVHELDELHNKEIGGCSVDAMKKGLNFTCSANPGILDQSKEKAIHPINVSPCAFVKVSSSSNTNFSKSNCNTFMASKSTAVVTAPNRKGNVNQSLTAAFEPTSSVVAPVLSYSSNLSVHSTTHSGPIKQSVKSDSCSSHGLLNQTFAVSSIINCNRIKHESSIKCPQTASRVASSSSSSQTSESDDSFESAKGESFDGAFSSELLQQQKLHGQLEDEEEEEEDDTDAALRNRAHHEPNKRREDEGQNLEKVDHLRQLQEEQDEEEDEEQSAGDVPHKPIYETEEEISKLRRRSNLKRKRSVEQDTPSNTGALDPADASSCVALPSAKRSRRGIKFDGVTVFYFPRSQGFSCVPSQGGSTLGMARRHFHIRKFSITDHLVEQRRMHKLQRLKRLAEEEGGGDGSCNYYLNRKPLAVESSCSSLYPSSSFGAPELVSGSVTCPTTSEAAASSAGQQAGCVSPVASNSSHANSSASHASGCSSHTTTSNAVSRVTCGISHVASSHPASSTSLPASSTNGVVALSCGLASSDDDTEEEGSELSEPEIDNDFCFLQPLAIRQRRSLLRESGIKAIESVEKEDCKDIRISREMCGCQCKLYCFPETCQCIEAGIKCQVDRHNFPCGCSVQGCGNPHGRIEFNPIRVRTHFLHTLMRLEIEKRQADQRAAFQQQQRSRWEEQRSRWLACLGSPLAALPSCSAAPETDGPHQPGSSGRSTPHYQAPPIDLVRQTCWLDSRGLVATCKADFKDTSLPPFACDFHPLDALGGGEGRTSGVWGNGVAFGNNSAPLSGFTGASTSEGGTAAPTPAGGAPLALAPPYTTHPSYYPALDRSLVQQQPLCSLPNGGDGLTTTISGALGSGDAGSLGGSFTEHDVVREPSPAFGHLPLTLNNLPTTVGLHNGVVPSQGLVASPAAASPFLAYSRECGVVPTVLDQLTSSGSTMADGNSVGGASGKPSNLTSYSSMAYDHITSTLDSLTAHGTNSGLGQNQLLCHSAPIFDKTAAIPPPPLPASSPTRGFGLDFGFLESYGMSNSFCRGPELFPKSSLTEVDPGDCSLGSNVHVLGGAVANGGVQDLNYGPNTINNDMPLLNHLDATPKLSYSICSTNESMLSNDCSQYPSSNLTSPAHALPRSTSPEFGVCPQLLSASPSPGNSFCQLSSAPNVSLTQHSSSGPCATEESSGIVDIQGSNSAVLPSLALLSSGAASSSQGDKQQHHSVDAIGDLVDQSLCEVASA